MSSLNPNANPFYPDSFVNQFQDFNKGVRASDSLFNPITARAYGNAQANFNALQTQAIVSPKPKMAEEAAGMAASAAQGAVGSGLQLIASLVHDVQQGITAEEQRRQDKALTEASQEIQRQQQGIEKTAMAQDLTMEMGRQKLTARTIDLSQQQFDYGKFNNERAWSAARQAGVYSIDQLGQASAGSNYFVSSGATPALSRAMRAPIGSPWTR